MKLPNPFRSAPAPDAHTDESDHGGGKGHRTPTRKEAEAARKKTLKVPSDPKEAKKAARQRAAAERDEARAALVSGDQKKLTGRDAGPVKAFVRDFIDRRWCAGELFLPIAILVLLGSFVRNVAVLQIVTFGWTAATLWVVIDTSILLRRLNKELKAQWPDAADRKGAIFYGLMRVLQIRRLRLPPPRFKAGGKPVEPKA
ncbi:MAG: DUF3043 domain-containing protein [Candidatus Nanopelagicales bacterium]